ncbi:DUF4403 family protein [Euzebyella saccharophila]|uniref:DUF4403 family protein n=1 Tax=Euzebyella saccharophila TaxID=679664 RepID=A0ABV8JQ40_9FLAO|nr:DUF4403 family protein [Euzebyella saccharophila]
MGRNILFIVILLSSITSCKEEVPNKYEYDYPEPIFNDSLVIVPSSSIFIPIKIEKDRIADIIVQSTPEKIEAKEASQRRKTKRFSIKANIIDGNTTFKNNKIIHELKIRDGHGSAGVRTYNDLGPLGPAYSAWVSCHLSDIRADAEAEVSFSLTENYDLIPTTSGKARISNAKAEGVNVTGLLRFFGEHVIKEDINDPIKNAIASLDLPKKIEIFWKNIQSPIKIGEDFHAFIEPDSLKYMKYRVGPEALETGLGLNFKMTTGNDNDSQVWNSEKPLPRLKVVDSINEKNINFGTIAKVPYSYINDLLSKKIEDEWIIADDSKGEKKEYFEITELELLGGNKAPMNLLLRAKATVLTSLLKNRVIYLYFNCNLQYNEKEKKIFIKEYELNTKTKGFLLDNFIDALANKLLYQRILNKLEFNLQSELNKVVGEFNNELMSGKEISDGVSVKGKMDFVSINQFQPVKDGIILTVNAKADLLLHVK